MEFLKLIRYPMDSPPSQKFGEREEIVTPFSFHSFSPMIGLSLFPLRMSMEKMELFKQVNMPGVILLLFMSTLNQER
jgi:hypothetical protein